MLDDANVLRQRDPNGALGITAAQPRQAHFEADIIHPVSNRPVITRVLVAGMGGSALAAGLARSWLIDAFSTSFEIIRDYHLPGNIDAKTLVIASSYSGNTEETLSALAQARQKGAIVAVIAAGGGLIDKAANNSIPHVQLPSGIQPRMTVLYNLRALTALLAHFGVLAPDYYDEIAAAGDWLQNAITLWLPECTVDKNFAKQLALEAVGKTALFYAGNVMAPIAYKWKISWNENAKNVAFHNEYPEFNHNEFIGWSSHPIEKPFAIFNLISNHEHPQTLKRFAISDKLLSGKRPHPVTVTLQGDTILQQMLWGCLLADFVSIYIAILNNVDPVPVALIEKLKQELA